VRSPSDLYSDFARALVARQLGLPLAAYLVDLSDARDGLRVMQLIEAAIASNEQDGAWVRVASLA